MARHPPESAVPRSLVIASAFCAAVVIASQLAGKTARDAIFLQYFEVRSLPLLLALSSALAIGTTFWFARRLVRGAPVRVVQLANAVSAALLVAEWLLLDHMPRPVSIAIYIHQTLLGPILVSGFWSIVSERFDPRSARHALGTIGFGATLGGLGGAILAERIAALVGTPEILPTVALLQVVATWQLSTIGRGRAEELAPEAPDEELLGAASQIARVSLLRRLAAITVVVTVAAALLDYVFKAVATDAVGTSHDLARLLAMFHGVVGVTTALVAWLFGRWALQSWGLARTLATLPGSVIVFGIVALLVPGVGVFVVLRGVENVLRNSLYREAYEVFYTPLLAGERRSTKTVIDVGVERFGDVLGGVIVVAVIAMLADPTFVLVLGAISLSVVGVYIALQAQHSYVEALERSLVAHAIEVENEPPDFPTTDRTTRTTLEMFAQRGAGIVKPPPRASASGGWFSRSRARREAPAKPPGIDPRIARLSELASGDPARIRTALTGPELPTAALPFVLPLIVHPELGAPALVAVQEIAHRAVGQLVDAMLDPELPVAVRGRIPGVLAGRVLPREDDHDSSTRSAAQIARAGLLAALADPERELRYVAAEALLVLREREPDLVFDDTIVFDGVRRELALDPHVWKALDVASNEAAHAVAEANPELTRAANHLSTLLALVLPAEPIRAAFQGLWSEDTAIRGVALEYLENVLPPDIREHLWLALAIEAPQHETHRSLEEVLGDLLQSRRESASA